jgi:hypothetical protein
MVNAQIFSIQLNLIRLKENCQSIQNGGLTDIVSTNDDIDGIVEREFNVFISAEVLKF